LAQAKRHLIENYMLVGVTERIEQMVYLLEQLLPNFFHGAGQHFRELDGWLILPIKCKMPNVIFF
jgi:hypothetical protein